MIKCYCDWCNKEIDSNEIRNGFDVVENEQVCEQCYNSAFNLLKELRNAKKANKILYFEVRDYHN